MSEIYLLLLLRLLLCLLKINCLFNLSRHLPSSDINKVDYI